MQIEIKYQSSKLKNDATASPPTPPPLPPKPKFIVTAKPTNKPSSTVVSVTNQEIAQYWRQKHIDEEDHLLAAIKAAARIRALNLSVDDYRQFEESLNEDDESKENNKPIKSSVKKDQNSYEIRVGIKDWWTKSKYAYLNQPVIQSMDIPKRRASSYNPQFYCYKSAPLPASTTFGIF